MSVFCDLHILISVAEGAAVIEMAVPQDEEMKDSTDMVGAPPMVDLMPGGLPPPLQPPNLPPTSLPNMLPGFPPNMPGIKILRTFL